MRSCWIMPGGGETAGIIDSRLKCLQSSVNIPWKGFNRVDFHWLGSGNGIHTWCFRGIIHPK